MLASQAEGALVARAKAGDRAAMAELLASVAPSIRRFALRMCRSEADADDVLQDALVSIATHLDTFEGRSSVPSWAFSLARSACAHRRRGKKNKPSEGEEVLSALPSEGPGPEEGSVARETSRIVAHALDTLPDDYREVLLLRDAEGLTAPEAATVLGVSVDALKSRLHRARASCVRRCARSSKRMRCRASRRARMSCALSRRSSKTTSPWTRAPPWRSTSRRAHRARGPVMR